MHEDPYEVLSTSVTLSDLHGQREELLRHGCAVAVEGPDRVRVEWPFVTRFDPQTSEYTLPDGWTVRLHR